MFSIQEITSKFADNLREIEQHMDASATFHPEDASIYRGLGPADQMGIRETLRAVPLRQLMEFLGKGTTLGNYLIADKVHDDLTFYATETDLAPLISASVVNGWRGTDLIVDVVDDESYKPMFTASGSISPTTTMNTSKCTLTPQTFTLNIRVAGDLEEDTEFALTDFHVRNAARAVGLLSTDMALNVLKNGPDGVGTANTEAAAADETNWLDIQNAFEANARDNFLSNTMITTHEAWTHSIFAGSEVAGGTAGDYGVHPVVQWTPPAAGFDGKYEMLDLKFSASRELHAAEATDAPGGAMTNCVTLVFDRNAALLTGRKRWMQLENYSDPVKDLGGAVISCRQDSVSLYKDATCAITET